MKRRISPVLLVLILIVLVAAAGIGTALIRRYMPSSEKMDGSEYFSLNDSSEAALVVNGELKEKKPELLTAGIILQIQWWGSISTADFTGMQRIR